MIPSRNLEEYNSKFEGKTCFIIGAGCSLIDQLPYFDKLQDHVTIAVNAGYLVYAKADFFLTDDWSCAHWSYFFEDLAASLNTTALLYEQKLLSSAGLFGHRSVLFKHRKGYGLTSPYSHSNRENFIWEARCSAGSAIHVAHIMGCKNIVLLGVDGRRVGDYRYFWQMPQWSGRKPFRNDHVKIDSFHRCKLDNVPSDVDLQSINQYWEMLGRSSGLKLYNASPISIIKGIPRISFSDALEDRFDA